MNYVRLLPAIFVFFALNTPGQEFIGGNFNSLPVN
jgi:hypothetical protein